MRDEPVDLTAPGYMPNRLLNKTAEFLGAPDDAALALMLDLSQAVICRVRKRLAPVSNCLMVKIIDRTDWTIKYVREMAGIPFYGGAGPILIQSERREFGGHRRGSANYNTKLDPDKVRKIRADPRPDSQVALDYGVHHSTIFHLRAGRTWKHVK